MRNEEYVTWKKEPDEYEFKHLGVKCLVVRNESMGHLCGYICVGRSHPVYGIDYDQLSPYFSPHGGLTYAGHLRGDQSEWVIGFDCAHYGDLIPNMASMGIINESDEYRDIGFVIDEIKNMVSDLIEQRDQFNFV